MWFWTLSCILVTFGAQIMADKEVTNCSCDFRIEGESGVYKGMFLKDSPTVLNTCQITDYYLCRAICYSQARIKLVNRQMSMIDPNTGESYGQSVCDQFNRTIDRGVGGIFSEIFCQTRSPIEPKFFDYFNYSMYTGFQVPISCKEGKYVVDKDNQLLKLDPFAEIHLGSRRLRR